MFLPYRPSYRAVYLILPLIDTNHANLIAHYIGLSTVYFMTWRKMNISYRPLYRAVYVMDITTLNTRYAQTYRPLYRAVY
mgnify:CR=1 FL=1